MVKKEVKEKKNIRNHENQLAKGFSNTKGEIVILTKKGQLFFLSRPTTKKWTYLARDHYLTLVAIKKFN